MRFLSDLPATDKKLSYSVQLLLFGLMLWWGVPVNAGVTALKLDIANINKSMAIEPYAQFLRDPDHKFTAREILNGDLDRLTQNNEGNTFNFGISNATFWLVFDLEYNDIRHNTLTTQRLLQINYPPLDRISLHYLDAMGEPVTFTTGDSLPFKNRPIINNAYIFPIELSLGETKRFVLEVRSEGSIRVPMTLWAPEAFGAHNENSLLLYGIYFGIIALMFMYNLILYIFVRDKSYLQYIFYIPSLTLFQSTYNGFAFQYLWPTTPELNNLVLILSLFLMLISGSLFTRTILDTATTLPLIHKLLTGFVMLFATMVLATPILPYHIALNIGIYCGVPRVLLIVVAGATNSLRGIRTARFFLLAWSSALIGGAVLGCVAAGILPVNSFTANAFIIGTALEVTLLSLSMADRVNRIERDRTLAEQQAKQALLEVNKTLLESNQIKDEFLNTISHEMRTPMHGVLSSIQHTRNETSDEKRNLFTDSAERSAQQMMMLIDSVLNYTELHSADLKLEKEPFRISRLVESLKQLFYNQAHSKGLEFAVEVDNDVPDLVIGDIRRTQQILINLMSNAIKFTHSGFVKLHVGLDAVDNRIYHCRLLFQVIDTGIGIPNGMENIIFDRFRQAHGGFNRGFGGLGIGLATSQAICQLMHADLSYNSIEKQGTTFNFVAEYPFSPRSNTAKKPDSSQYQWRDIVIDRVCLIVEDNTVNQMVLKATLNKLGLHTVLAKNGKEALELLAIHPVDIILMDCQMPVMDGFEATDAIRKLETNKAMIPIIAVTANAMSKDRERCVEAGMNDYMSKPIDVHELKDKLMKWLPLTRQNDGAPAANIIKLDDKRDRNA